METITPREAPELIFFNDETHEVTTSHKDGSTIGLFTSFGSVKSWKGAQDSDHHLHALRTAEINGQTVTEYDVGTNGSIIALWDGNSISAFWIDMDAPGKIDWSCVHGFHDGRFSALKHPEKIEAGKAGNIKVYFADAHPLLAQAVARVNPNQTEIARIETEMRKLADDLEKLK